MRSISCCRGKYHATHMEDEGNDVCLFVCFVCVWVCESSCVLIHHSMRQQEVIMTVPASGKQVLGRNWP